MRLAEYMETTRHGAASCCHHQQAIHSKMETGEEQTHCLIGNYERYGLYAIAATADMAFPQEPSSSLDAPITLSIVATSSSQRSLDSFFCTSCINGLLIACSATLLGSSMRNMNGICASDALSGYRRTYVESSVQGRLRCTERCGDPKR